MSLFNFEKKRISEPINQDIIKEQDQEFGSMSPEKILEQKELLKKQVDDFSNKPIVEGARVTKESEEDKNKEIEKLKESIGI